MDEPTSGLLDIRDLPELQRARTLWVNQHWDRAEAEFCRIADSHPSNWHALLDAARVLGDRQEIRRSRALLDRLISLAADREDLLLQVAQTCRMSRREPAALELLQRYTARGPGRHDPVGHLELAVLYERQQRLDEAEASAQAALKAAPHWMEALIILARVRRQRGETIRAEAALQRVIRAPRVADSTRSQAWAMWADMADRSGHPAVAIDRLERAKDLMRPAAGGLADHGLRILRAWERVARQCAPETLARWQAAGSPATDRHPIPAHLLGFPRSGTTLLENILEAHSRLVSSEESQVLGRDLLGVLWRAPEEDIPPTVAALESVPPGKLGALRRRYWERMAEGLGLDEWPSVHLDKNPTHTLFIPAILRLLPDSRFLVALRDPRDVVVSCYFQWFPLNSNSASFLSWQRAVDRYLLDMGAWLLLREKLPPATWLEVRYEDVVADFAGQARRALDFLDLSWEDGVLDYRNHLATKAVHTPSYLEIRRPVHAAAVGRWKKYARWMEPHINRLRPLVEALGYAW